MIRLHYHNAALLFALLALATSGCTKPPAAASDLPSDEELKALIDDQLNYTYTQRYLNLTDHAAWQIFHGVLPFSTDFKVYDGDKLVPAIDWVLDGNTMRGWTPQHGDELEVAGPDGRMEKRQGLKMLVETGKFGQGHPDQWLSILGQSGIKSDHKLIYDGREYEVRDVMLQALHDIHASPEWSWTLSSILIYLGPDAKWTSNGEEWTVERVVALEAKQDLGTSACGGTHRLSALNRAVKAYRKQHGEPKGAWADAEKKVRDAIKTAEQFQQPDGALSTRFFVRPQASGDEIDMMYSTGHTVEFLALSVSDEELNAPWMKRAVVKLCKLFQNTRAIDVECGSLYHATNGLKKYRERKFGPWTPPKLPGRSQDSISPASAPVKTPENSPRKDPAPTLPAIVGTAASKRQPEQPSAAGK